MITGLMVLDKDGHVFFEPNKFMLHQVLGHTSLVEEMSEKNVVLYGKSSYYLIHGTRVHHDSSKVFIGEELEEVEKKHPFSSIIIMGNKTILRYLDKIDTLMVVKYRSAGINPEPDTFELPDDPVSICKLINYDIFTYRLNK
jgi:hypothetical protein